VDQRLRYLLACSLVALATLTPASAEAFRTSLELPGVDGAEPPAWRHGLAFGLWNGVLLGVFAILLLASNLAFPTRVEAYRTAAELVGVDDAGSPSWWHEPQIRIAPGAPSELAFTDAELALSQALGVWNGVGCDSPTLAYAGVGPVSGVLGDGISTVDWVSWGWLGAGYSEDAMAATELDIVERAERPERTVRRPRSERRTSGA
jgi:hypothetical protein